MYFSSLLDWHTSFCLKFLFSCNKYSDILSIYNFACPQLCLSIFFRSHFSTFIFALFLLKDYLKMMNTKATETTCSTKHSVIKVLYWISNFGFNRKSIFPLNSHIIFNLIEPLLYCGNFVKKSLTRTLNEDYIACLVADIICGKESQIIISDEAFQFILGKLSESNILTPEGHRVYILLNLKEFWLWA